MAERSGDGVVVTLWVDLQAEPELNRQISNRIDEVLSALDEGKPLPARRPLVYRSQRTAHETKHLG